MPDGRRGGFRGRGHQGHQRGASGRYADLRLAAGYARATRLPEREAPSVRRHLHRERR